MATRILYTTTDGKGVTPYDSTKFLDSDGNALSITSNTYIDGQGVITLGGDCVTMGEWVFNACSTLASITIPSGVTTIGQRAFSNCSGLTSVTIADTVTSIASYAFYKCSSLVDVAMSSGLVSLGDDAFYECTSLTSITLPSGVTEIGNYTFSYDTGLTAVTCYATTPPTLGSGVFYMASSCPIYVPSASVASYKSATNWSNYASRIEGLTGEISVTPTTKTFAYSGGSQEFTISTTGSVGTFTATLNDTSGLFTLTLILPTPSASNPSGFLITANANTTNVTKTATVVISGDSITTHVISVSIQPTPSISVTPTGKTFGYAGGSQEFTISTTGEVGTFSVTLNDTSGLFTIRKPITPTGENPTGFTITASRNATTEIKTASVIISGASITTQNVSLSIYPSPRLSVTPSGATFAYSGGTQTFDVETTITTPSITYLLTDTSGLFSLTNMSQSGFTVSASPNTTTSAKTASVYLDAESLGQTIPLTIDAGPEAGISVTPTTKTFAYSGGSQEFTISTTGAVGTFTTTLNDTSGLFTLTLILPSPSATNPSGFLITANANTTNVTKSATVVISGASITTHVISVSIQPTPSIAITPSGASYTYTGGSQTFAISTTGSVGTITYQLNDINNIFSIANSSQSGVTISATTNTASITKTATLTAGDGTTSKTANLSIDPSPSITLDATALVVTASGGSKSVGYSTIGTVGTINATQTGGLTDIVVGGDEITFNVPANTTYAIKSYTLTASGTSGGSATLNISQYGLNGNSNVIVYQSTAGVITPNTSTGWGASIVSNVQVTGTTYCITFDAAVLYFPDGAFSGKTALTYITVPSEVESMGDNVFEGCSNLAKIDTFATDEPSLGTDTFTGVKTGGVLNSNAGGSYNIWLDRHYNLGLVGWNLDTIEEFGEWEGDGNIVCSTATAFTLSFKCSRFADYLNFYPCYTPEGRWNPNLEAKFPIIDYTGEPETGVGVSFKMPMPTFDASTQNIWFMLEWTDLNGESNGSMTMVTFLKNATEQTFTLLPEIYSYNIVGTSYVMNDPLTMQNMDVTSVTATVTAGTSWLTASVVDIVDGADDTIKYGTLRINATANNATDAEPRTGGVLVSGKTITNTTKSFSVSVTQQVNTGNYYIQTTPTGIKTSYTSQDGEYAFTFRLGENITTTAVTVSTNATWCEAMIDAINIDTSSTGAGHGTVRYRASENEDDEERKANITLLGITANGDKVFGEFYIVQAQQPTKSIKPVWEDNWVSYTSYTLSHVDFKLNIEGTDIYRGKSYLINNSCRFKLNEIYEGYITARMGFNGDYDDGYWTEVNNGLYNVRLFISEDDGNTWYIFKNWDVRYDWSYTYDAQPTSPNINPHAICLNMPILNFADWRQFILGTFIKQTNYTMTDDMQYYFKREGQSLVARSFKNWTTETIVISALSHAEKLAWDDGQESKASVEFANRNSLAYKFPIRKTNNAYCLYYRNLYGGWDFMLLNPTSKKSVKITPLTYTDVALNYTRDFGVINYHNTIQATWTLKTPLLTDAQSKLMKHIYLSTMMFLHNLETQEITPVIMDTTSYDDLNFKNNSGKPCQYTIKVKASQTQRTR